MGLFLGATELSTGGGGGGGFTKMNKYSTSRAIGGDTVIKQGPPVPLTVQANRPGNSSFVTVKYTDSSFDANFSAANAFVGYFFYWSDPNQGGVTTNVITSSTANTGANSTFTINFSPNAVQSMTVNNTITTYAAPITVNPATDLGLADGASIAYFMCGGGTVGPTNNHSYTGYGGRIIQGTEIITTASTNLVLTPGQGENQVCVSNSFSSTPMTESTITGGLTLSTADGSRQAGFRTSTGDGNGTPGSGVNGYGTGGGGRGYNDGAEAHGFGGGTRQSSNTGSYPPANFNFQAGDGAILLFY